MQKHWSLLWDDPDLQEILAQHPTVTYRIGKNFKRMFAAYPLSKQVNESSRMWLSNPTVGSHRRGHCKACDYMPTVNEFVNPTDGRKYQVRRQWKK